MRYDEEKERYVEKTNGRDEVVPRVTALIRWAGLCNPHKYTPGSAERGRLIHTLCEEYDTTGEIPEHESKVEAYANWLKESGANIVQTELMLGSWELGYAGRCDRVCVIDGRMFVVDLKSGHKEPWHPLQVAAYVHAYETQTTHRGVEAAVLYLLDSGRYRFSEVENLDNLRAEWVDIVRRYHEEATPWD